MRPSSNARLRLALRDLAAAVAFGSMAISGAVPGWADLAFAAGLLLALLDIRPLARRSTFSAVLLGAAAVLLYAPVAAGRLDLVLAACTFAGLITLFRMLAAPDPKTDGQVHLTSLLMLCGGAALSGEMLFGICLLIFALLSMLSLGLGVVQSATSGDQPVPTRSAAGHLAAGGVGALLVGMVLFAAIPRISWNVAGRRATPGLAMSVGGMSDRVTLRGDGRIKTNPRIIARVRIAPDPGSPSLDVYWLGRTFDSFNGQEWAIPGAAALGASRGGRWRVDVRRWRGPSLRQDIELLPGYGSRALIALETPVSFANAVARTADGNHRSQLVELPGHEVSFVEHAPGYSYEAQSIESGLRSGEAEDDSESPGNLQLPRRLDERVTGLARSIAGKEGDPVKVARRLESYLKGHYGYSLNLTDDPADPLVDFLFVRKEGHCEQFATALTIMLRALGIPSRLATGFYGGERIRDHYVLRAGDAHAWTQLVLAGGAILSLDATPEGSRAGQSTAMLDWIVRSYETLSERWRSSVVEYSIQDQKELAHGLAVLRSTSARAPRLSMPWLAAAATGLLVVFSRRRFAGLAHLRRDGAATLLARTERVLARAGLRREPGECFEEMVARVSPSPIGRALNPLAQRYLEARFGGRPLRRGEGTALLQDLARSARRQVVQSSSGRRALDTETQGD